MVDPVSREDLAATSWFFSHEMCGDVWDFLKMFNQSTAGENREIHIGPPPCDFMSKATIVPNRPTPSNHGQPINPTISTSHAFQYLIILEQIPKTCETNSRFLSISETNSHTFAIQIVHHSKNRRFLWVSWDHPGNLRFLKRLVPASKWTPVAARALGDSSWWGAGGRKVSGKV